MSDKLKIAQKMREEANRLEIEAHCERNLPKKWKVGMRVRFLNSQEWGWAKGSEATVKKLSDECDKKAGHEYQVFWTVPDSGFGIWWTTTDDVELVE